MLYKLSGPPTVETHSESVMYLFVRDAHGAPVAGARVKVWAGPPPTGQPPYFVDEVPFRTTSASGRLEYVVFGGVMPETRDYWMQVVAASGVLQSDPVQFRFPQSSAIWITAILDATGGGGSGGGTQPVNLDWDPRLTNELNIILQAAQVAEGQRYWKLVRARYLPPGNEPGSAQGRINIYYTVLNENGQPLVGQRVWQEWPDDRASRPTGEGGVTDFMMSGDSSFDPRRGERGPYKAYVDGVSDVVVGLVLPLKQHVCYELTWRKTVKGPIAPPTNSSIVGRITNAPPGTQVTLTSSALTRTVTPDGTGGYGFTQLPAGTYSISVTGIGVIRSNIVLDGTNSVQVDYTFAPIQPSKTLTHYLLFGAPNLSATRTNLILALDYIACFAPAVGFSVSEAKNAQNVTLVGANAIGAADEQTLRSAGCTVRHIAGADSYEMEQLFARLIASGSPYPST